MAYSRSSSSSDSECRSTQLMAAMDQSYLMLSRMVNAANVLSRLESVEARLVYYKKNEAVLEDSINVLKLESLNEILECQVIDKFKKGLGYDAATAASPAVEGFVNLTDKFGSDKAYHVVPSPLSRNFLPGKPDLTFIDEIVESENLDVTTVVTPKCCAPINEELVSDGKKKTIVPTIPKVDVVCLLKLLLKRLSVRVRIQGDGGASNGSESVFETGAKSSIVLMMIEKITSEVNAAAEINAD
ncbi:hypothetical protein Tco_0146370 [Tanacetum coccineum]